MNEGAIGGQMVFTNEIANYPGVELTQGYALAGIMKRQAKEFGCKLKSNIKIKKYHLTGDVKSVEIVEFPISLLILPFIWQRNSWDFLVNKNKALFLQPLNRNNSGFISSVG